MSIDQNDSRMTAYALGEMSDEERSAFQAELGDDQGSRDEIEAIRETASLLDQELGQGRAVSTEP